MSEGRALGLVSGGLDSTLACRVLQDQGIEVIGVHFNTGFCLTDTRRQVGRRRESVQRLRSEALRAGSDLDVPVEIVDVSGEYLQIVTHPRWGYGKNANPCIDCRIMMLTKARGLMQELGARFIFTGEVLGQRPMTQYRGTMRQIEKASGLDGFLLRPLSAQRLPETEPEKRGWVDRSRLLGLSGRSRKPQFALAAQMGLTDFPQPAGGCCFLTDPSFGRKFFDFMRHLPPGKIVSLEDFVVLKVGRHLRLTDRLKVVLGRDEAENDFLENYTAGRWALRAAEVVGPLALVDPPASGGDLELAARAVARYCDGRDQASVTVRCEGDGETRMLTVAPFSAGETAQWVIK
ncbi:MAG: thiamine biosynthesis protein [Candidatus Zixiibacteriota bacterium]|nr:MAG: thiamine biosynthesis protein [candidate division Zixibacteria bacterium]